MKISPIIPGPFFGMPSDQDTKFYDKHKNYHQDVKVPTWIEYHLNIAAEISKRSKDAQTKCGCVITNQSHHILSTGYNSFVRGLPDDKMPNLRPNKYPFMIHAEMNAIFNRESNWFLYPQGVRAYITSRPCLTCLQALWQNNVTEIFYSQYSKPVMLDGQDDDFNFFLSVLPIRVSEVDFGTINV